MKEYLINIFKEASKKLDYLKSENVILTIPKSKELGDYSTNIALILSKELKNNPRKIADEIVANLDYDKSIIEKIEIAGPGFINFFFSNVSVTDVIKRILSEDEKFGKSEKHLNQKAIVEFVSANPTGPLTVGHGRNAVLGDTVANLLEWIGYDVTREYYFNNAGRQMRVLGDSVKHRYLQLLGDDLEFPEDYYQGEYIKDIAKELYKEYGDGLRNEKPEGIFKERAEKLIFNDIEKTLANLKIGMNTYFNENSLYEDKKIDHVLGELKNKNLSYEKDDAVWFKLTAMGKEQDKVIVKSSGEPTYRLPDIAYHKDKFDRGFDLIVDIFGSDHNATYPDVLAGCEALGYDTSKVKVLIHQFVTILDKGEVVKMSTRKANFVTLDELINEVGADVVRYFFIMRNMTTHLNFELDLAKKQSEENPVFYLQYAHARIASILRMTSEQDLKLSTDHLNLLVEEAEQDLLKKLHQFEENILYAAENFEPHKVTNYLEELAASFHRFYTECRIIGSEKNLAEARIALVTATKIVIRNGLSLLKINAPDRM